MGYGALDSIGRTSLMMNLIAQKQRALGSNLANVDTPGYVRRDIDFSQYLVFLRSLGYQYLQYSLREYLFSNRVFLVR